MDKDYLAEDYDPGKVKVSRLRSILRENNVEIPAGAKKRELVRLFNENLSSKSQAPSKIEHPTSDSEIEVVEDEVEQQNIINARSKKQKTRSKPAGEATKPVKSESEIEDSKSVTASPKVENTTVEKSNLTDSKIETSEEGTPEGGNDTSEPSTLNSPRDSKKVRKSKKRKSSVLENDLEEKTPTKGNLFQVDVDSDADTVIFSPKPKKIKTSPPASELKKKSKRQPSEKKPSRNSISPATDIAKSAYEDVKSSLSRSTPTKINMPAPTAQVKQSPNPSQNGVNRPVLAPVPDSTTEASGIDTNESSSIKEFSSMQEAFEDDAKHFDSALADLKHEISNEDTSRESKDEQLAKLFRVDPSGVKPKPKGRRNITPRRPIIISERRLSSQNKSLVEDLLNDQKADLEPSMHVKEEAENQTLSDEEADTDIEEEEVTTEIDHQSKKRNSIKSSKLKATFAFMGLWVVFLGLAMFGYWYREQTILVGYCGNEIIRPTIPESPETPQLLSFLGNYLDDNFRPSCVPCPQHARCFPRLNLACYEDFVEYKPYYYDLWPAFDPKAKRCIPDTKKAEKVELMIDEALELLRARNANIQCGSTAVDNFEAGIEVNELHDLLLALKAPYITEEEFEDLWKRSVVELEKEPEITVKRTAYNVRAPGIDKDEASETHDEDTIFRSTSLSHISLMCHLSNHMVDLLVSLIPHLTITAIVIIVAFVAHSRFRQSRLQAQRVETLYNEVLSKLRKQAKTARESSDIPAYIGSIQLRDLILSNEGNLARKMRLWEAVSRKVDRNTNVKGSLLEVHGEVMKVWQWISHLE